MNIRSIRSPQVGRPTKSEQSLFIAGGITDCDDWQQLFIQLLEAKTKKLAVFNPRQLEYKYGDKDAAVRQIHWEHQHLQSADAIVFWFCAHQIQPISLFELGKYFDSETHKIFVGVSPRYPRSLDIVTQVALGLHSKIDVVDNLSDLAEQVAIWNGVSAG